MPILNTAEFAAKCGVSDKTIRRWVKEGKVQAVRTPGGHLRFDTDVILNAEAAIPSGMEGMTAFLRLQMVKEAKASVALDRDQTHVIGPVVVGRPLRDDDPPHEQPEPKVDINELRKTLVETQGRLINELVKEVHTLDDDKRELLDQLQNAWKIREGYGLVKIHDLMWFQGLMGQEVAAGYMYQHHLDYYADMIQRSLGMGWAEKEYQRLERLGEVTRRTA